jgi:hypothetical protein
MKRPAPEVVGSQKRDMKREEKGRTRKGNETMLVVHEGEKTRKREHASIMQKKHQKRKTPIHF